MKASSFKLVHMPIKVHNHKASEGVKTACRIQLLDSSAVSRV